MPPIYEGRVCLAEAGDRARTGDPNLGKVVLYQLSYTRIASRRAGDYIADSFFLSKPKYPRAKRVTTGGLRSPA